MSESLFLIGKGESVCQVHQSSSHLSQGATPVSLMKSGQTTSRVAALVRTLGLTLFALSLDFEGALVEVSLSVSCELISAVGSSSGGPPPRAQS